MLSKSGQTLLRAHPIGVTAVIIGSLLTAAAPVSALPTVWAGTLSFDEANLQTKDAPLNVTIQLGQPRAEQATAGFTWYFSRYGPANICHGQLEPTLTWSVSSSGLVTAEGNGETPDFYSFQGQLDGTTNTINGTIYHPPFPSKRQACGSFTIRPVGAASPLKPPQCKAEPPPHPSPLPPPHPSVNAHKNPSMWPAPAGFTRTGAGSRAIVDAAALTLTCDGGSAGANAACTSIITPAFARGKTWAFMVDDADTTGATLKTVTVAVIEAVPLQLGVNESYSLTVNSTHASVVAPTQWGALYGLESFFQLLLIEPWEECEVCNKYVVKGDVPFSIVDAPRVRWRGLMIDYGRHYLPVELIKTTIDAMAAAKMNALHWHLTDDQSFPLCLDSQPQLCRLSQFRDHVTGAPQNYTPAAIADVVGYATARGVRVIPELDLPGHSTGLRRGAPQVYLNCSTGTHPLPDPTGEGFFELIDSIVGELAGEFPDAFLHMGGDEVNTTCWTENAAVAKWMRNKNLTVVGVLGYFKQRIQAIVAKHGKRAMFWDEFWAAGLPALDSTVAEIRGPSPGWAQTLSKGRQALTTGINEAWYLDHGVANPRFIQMDWEPYYAHDPFEGLSPEQLQYVLGGEVDMWGEGVDITNFESRVFPWATAVGERLWSPAAQTREKDDTVTRLTDFRCLLVKRGVRAAPVGAGAPC